MVISTDSESLPGGKTQADSCTQRKRILKESHRIEEGTKTSVSGRLLPGRLVCYVGTIAIPVYYIERLCKLGEKDTTGT
jgi:hypothetical protein